MAESSIGSVDVFDFSYLDHPQFHARVYKIREAGECLVLYRDDYKWGRCYTLARLGTDGLLHMLTREPSLKFCFQLVRTWKESHGCDVE